MFETAPLDAYVVMDFVVTKTSFPYNAVIRLPADAHVSQRISDGVMEQPQGMDTIQVPVRPITRSRVKKLHQAMLGFVKEILDQQVLLFANGDQESIQSQVKRFVHILEVQLQEDSSPRSPRIEEFQEGFEKP
ncbi:hypothetical protein ACH5RR_008828 [Cinchona calisaya]|uniref:Uncharacterized protein n=1 Tax=Cinchona calisaya TaxID=153742 RepID=A0ABD3ACK7_9GENT